MIDKILDKFKYASIMINYVLNMYRRYSVSDTNSMFEQTSIVNPMSNLPSTLTQSC